MNSNLTDNLERTIRKARLADEAATKPFESRYAFVQTECGDDTRLLSEVLHLLQPFPETIGPYRPFRVIGFGGMGEVYAARQEGKPQDFVVAVKVIRFGKESPKLRARFERERRNLFRINHPNVVEMKDCGVTEDGHPYIVMRYLDGATEVTEYCKDRSKSEVLTLFVKLCAVLRAVHGKGVVHGDLKPSNIAIVSGEPFLLDFGLSELLADDGGTDDLVRMTAFSEWYVAPEILSGGKATKQSDIRALGAVMLECLAGHPPFKPKIQSAIKKEIRQDEPTPPKSWPKELRAILQRTLRRDPSRRYSSADLLKTDIESYLEHKPLAADTLELSRWEQLDKWRRRNPSAFWLTAAAASLVLLLGIGGVAAAGREHRMLVELQLQEQKRRGANELRSAFDALERGNLREAAFRGIHAARLDSALPLESLLLRVDALLPSTFAQFTFEGGVESVEFSAKGDLLVVTGQRGRVLVVRVPSFLPFYEENCGGSAPAAFRPDGERLAIACGSLTIKIMEAHSAHLLREIHVQNDPAGMKWSPDGKVLAVRSGKLVLLFDAESGRQLGTITHVGAVGPTQVTFSEDNRWLATASESGLVIVSETTTGKTVSTLPLPTGYGSDFTTPKILQFAKGNRLLVGLNTGQDPARVWTITNTGQAVSPIPVQGIFRPLSAEIRPSLWLYAGMDHEGMAVSIENQRDRWRISSEGIQQIMVSGRTGGEPQVLTVQSDGTARVWRTGPKEFQEYRRIVQQFPIVQAAVDPQGSFAATADEQGHVQISDISVAMEAKILPPAIHYRVGPKAGLPVAEDPEYDDSGPWISRKGRYIARQLTLPERADSREEPNAVQVLPSGDLAHPVYLPTYDRLLDVAFSPEEDLIAWTSLDQVRIASTATWKTIETIKDLGFTGEYQNFWVRFTSDGLRLLIVRFSKNGTSELQLRDAKSGRLLGHRRVLGRVITVETSQRRHELAIGVYVGDTEGSVSFFDERDLLELRETERLPHAPTTIRYSPDGRYVGLLLSLGLGEKQTDATMEMIPKIPSYEEYVEVQEAASGRSLFRLSSHGGFLGLAFSDDGRTLRITHRFIGPVAVQSTAFSGADVVELPSGRKIDEAHSAKVQYLKFGNLSRSGRWMFGVDRDTGESSLIDLVSGTQTLEVGDHSKLDSPEFSEDGHVLLDVMADKRLRVRRLDAPGLIEAFCAKSPGDPSLEEWRRWMGSAPYQKACAK